MMSVRMELQKVDQPTPALPPETGWKALQLPLLHTIQPTNTTTTRKDSEALFCPHGLRDKERQSPRAWGMRTRLSTLDEPS